MSLRAPLITGTIVSLAVTAAWAWSSALTIGPAGPLDLTWRHPGSSYLLLAAAPAGNGWELFAGCFLVSGLRCLRRAGGDDG